MRILVTRPREDGAELARTLRAAGHEVLSDPLLAIELKPDVPLTRARVQALLVTSANGLRALAVRRDFAVWKDVPLYAVGPTTAALARESGFHEVHEAAGDAVSLAALATDLLDPEGGPLLHVSGTVIAGDLKGALERDGFWVERAELYEAKAAEALSPETVAALRDGGVDAVLLYSRRSAEIFVALCREARLLGTLSGVAAYCLSANAADPLQGLGLADIHVAPSPNETDLLALIRA